MTERRFRMLLWIHVGLAAAAAVASTFPPHPDDLEAAVDAASTSWLWGQTWLMLGIAVVLLAAWIAGLVGLYRFARWGRTLSLWATLATLLLYPFFGSMLYWGLESGLHEASTLAFGALLAMAYWSPVSARFEAKGGGAGITS